MSNSIDVLCVGGPRDGLVFCLPLTRTPSYLSAPVVGGEVIYSRAKWQHPLTAKWYHIAVRPDDPPTDEEITVTIVMYNFTPAWDLN